SSDSARAGLSSQSINDAAAYDDVAIVEDDDLSRRYGSLRLVELHVQAVTVALQSAAGQLPVRANLGLERAVAGQRIERRLPHSDVRPQQPGLTTHDDAIEIGVHAKHV